MVHIRWHYWTIKIKTLGFAVFCRNPLAWQRYRRYLIHLGSVTWIRLLTHFALQIFGSVSSQRNHYLPQLNTYCDPTKLIIIFVITSHNL